MKRFATATALALATVALGLANASTASAWGELTTTKKCEAGGGHVEASGYGFACFGGTENEKFVPYGLNGLD
ncbi:hypothetical protein [Streptomyces sp. HNM0574]|uniref:hypothetical protein n=1 Tax=Streptomyces sp. HNM0574 TaxID=2714954 RepID=UPI00146BF76C|nr:hypothetical protein [Streptomyces sp. HNM0574]NLU68236.1 hypothetical protein [Streptomyces sp. HNM0574]